MTTALGTLDYYTGLPTKKYGKRAQKSFNQFYDKFQEMSTSKKLVTFALIAVFLIALLLIWRLYAKQSEDSLFLSQPLFMTGMDHGEPHNTKEIYYYERNNRRTPFIPGDLVREGNSTRYTYSFWIYVNTVDWAQYKFGEWKHIFHRGTAPLTNIGDPKKVSSIDWQTPGFWLAPKTNRLICAFNREQVSLEDIDMNKWINVVMVLDIRSVSLYLNGKLERTITLQNQVMQSKSNLYVNYFGGFGGWMSYLQFYNRALEPADVYRYYEKMQGKIDAFMKKYGNKMLELHEATKDTMLKIETRCAKKIEKPEEDEKGYSYEEDDLDE